MSVNLNQLEFWRAFGDKRFTKADLWRAFGRNESSVFPTPEFVARFHLNDCDWIDEAPGPRGGEGWKINDSVVAEIAKQEQKKARRRAASEDVLKQVVVVLGSLRMEPGFTHNQKDRLVWSFFPAVAIEGRNLHGEVRQSDMPFSLSLPANSRLDVVQGEVDLAISHVRELAAAQKARLVKQIKVLDDLAMLSGR